MKMNKLCIMLIIIIISMLSLPSNASAQAPGDCIECSSCALFETWKFICTFIGQICTIQGLPSNFCQEQVEICEESIDSLVAECRRICDENCSEPDTCNGGAPDGKCEDKENCPQDASVCDDKKCYEPICTYGCGETPVSSGSTDEACGPNAGCATPPCSCDGNGNCATVPVTPECHPHANHSWITSGEYEILVAEKGCTDSYGTEYLIEIRDNNTYCGERFWIWLELGNTPLELDKCYLIYISTGGAGGHQITNVEMEITCPECEPATECHQHEAPGWLTANDYDINVLEEGCTDTCGTEYHVEFRDNNTHCGERLWVWLEPGTTPLEVDKCYKASLHPATSTCGPMIVDAHGITCPECEETPPCVRTACEYANTNLPCMCGSKEATANTPWCCAADSSVFPTSSSCITSPSCHEEETPPCARTACEYANTNVPCMCGSKEATANMPWCCAADNNVYPTEHDCITSPSCHDDQCKIIITFDKSDNQFLLGKSGIASGKTEYCPGDSIVITIEFLEDGKHVDYTKISAILKKPGNIEIDLLKYLKKISTGIYEIKGSVGSAGVRTLEVKATFGDCKDVANASQYTVLSKDNPKCAGGEEKECDIITTFDREYYCEEDRIEITTEFWNKGVLSDPTRYGAMMDTINGITDITDDYNQISTGVYVFKGSVDNDGHHSLYLSAYFDGCHVSKTQEFFVYSHDECPNKSTCTDTDVTSEHPDGKNYYVRGTTKWGPISGKHYNATDGCDTSGKTLSEHYCSGGYSTVEYYTCPDTCKDGACIRDEYNQFSSNTTIVYGAQASAPDYTYCLGELKAKYPDHAIKQDDDVNASDKESKNLILLSGPAGNRLVAELADVGKTPTVAEWMDEYQDCYIVQIIEDAYTVGKDVLIIAGWDVVQSKNACNHFLENKAPTSKTCVGEEEPNCTDTDGGKNYDVKGYATTDSGHTKHEDSCTYDKNAETYTLHETYCENNKIKTEAYKCPDTCKDGACIDEEEPKCTDTDGGRDYYKRGEIYWSVQNFRAKDVCRRGYVHEYYCEGDMYKETDYRCPNGCKDGACIKGKEPYCSAIGSRSEGWYQNNELITWDNCNGCYAVCKHVGTDSEGWYSSCNSKLIKHEDCGCYSDKDCEVSSTAPNQFCEFPESTCKGPGKCTEKPDVCPRLYDPVCGCDSKTYSNDCARQAAGVSKKYNGKCKEEPPCKITSASITSYCKGGSSSCEAGEQIRFNVRYDGSNCPSESNMYIQIDAKSADGSCRISYVGGDISGIYSRTSGSTGVWTIPAIPDKCKGKTITPTLVGLYNGGPPGTGKGLDWSDAIIGSFGFAGGSEKCTDTDGGRDYYKKGEIHWPVQNFRAKDACRSGYVHEYYCEGDMYKETDYRCPNGCKDGACIKGKEPYCSAIGSRSEGWYQQNGRIKWDNCNGCYAVCKYADTGSEGWYSSCDDKLIKWEKCGEESLSLMEGDADLNGCVSLADSDLIRAYLVGSKTLTPNQLKCADTNDDGAVTLKDSTAIKMWLEDSSVALWQSPADDDMAKPIACQPSITVTSPNGGEQWVIGNTYDITWNSTGIENVYIGLATEDGSGYLITRTTPSSAGRYSLTLEEGSHIGSGSYVLTDYKVYVADATPGLGNDATRDLSDDYFSIVSETTCNALQNQSSCLDNSNCYWDQQYDNCRTYDSTKQTCSDPDNGKDIYFQAHTYGFRQTYANERDKRIRTGGKDACIGDKLREHYCVDDYYIRTYDVECPNGCANGACKRDEAAKSINVLSPNGGEQWVIGNTYDITWNSTGIENVYIGLATEDGSGYLITRTTPSSAGRYSLTLEEGSHIGSGSYVLTDYKVYVADATPGLGNDATRDLSDDYFSIVDKTCADWTCDYVITNYVETLLTYDINLNKVIDDTEAQSAAYDHLNNQISKNQMCAVTNAWKKNCILLMEGDADLNGCVSLADSDLIRAYLVGSKTLTLNQLKCADTNDDGAVTLKDSTAIKMWLEDSSYPLWQSPADDHMAKPVACVSCEITSASITPVCSGGESPNCETGEQIDFSVNYNGNGCPGVDTDIYIQIDAKSTDGTCKIEYVGGDISGIYSGNSGSTGVWTIPAIPDKCKGKTITPTLVGLYSGGPPGTGKGLDWSDAVTGSFELVVQ